MNFHKNIISIAVLSAVSSIAVASEAMPSIPDSFDAEVVQTDLTNQHYDGLTFEQGKVGVVKPTLNDAGGSPSFIYSQASQEGNNLGTIWVLAGDLGEDGEYGKYATGMLANGEGAKAINTGTIYVKANTGPFNKEAAKAMASDNKGSLVNNGTIIVDGATAMALTTKADGQTIQNNNQIIVKSGYGITVNINDKTGDAKSVTVGNNGTIVTEKGAVAAQFNSSFNDGTFTNSGSILGEGISINASSASNFTLKLKDNSHIEGSILLASDSTIYANELTNKEAININRAGTIKVDDSDLIIKNTSPYNTLKIGTVDADASSSVNFSFDKLGSESKKLLEVDNVTGDGSVGIEYTASVSDALAAGADKNDLFAGIKLGQDGEPETVYVSNDGSAWGSSGYYTKDKETGAISEQLTGTNTLLSSATDLAITNALMWRSQLSNLTDRMGTLRTMPETAGAWARYNGGRLDGRGIQHDYNTVEVGFDKAISNNVMLGISFDYTKGDTDLDAGTSDNNTYTLGLYGSYFNEAGCFLDAMLKVGRIDSDYDLNNGIQEKGDYMLTGTIVGIETGHRWNIQNYFIEPQVQLTYSYLRPENYNTNLREVKFDDMKSLIARVGIMGGVKFAEDRGSAYVKASYNHDFLGDIEGNYSGFTAAGDAVRVNIDDELDDNWGEVSLGASYQVTDSVNTFVDVGTGFGGDIDQKWRVNLGARYVF